MSFTDWPWRHWCAQFTHKPALRLNDEVLSWQQLCARIDSLAAGFHRQGVEEGDGVLLLAHNHPTPCWRGWRCSSAGRVFFPLIRSCRARCWTCCSRR